MACSLKFLGTCLTIYCTSLFLCSDFCFACVFEKNNRVYDLSTLDWPDWQAVGKKNGSDVVLYDVSICRPLNYSMSPEKELCKNTSVCRHSNGKVTEMGQFTLSNISVYDGVLQGAFMLFLTGSECPPGAETKYYAIINFLCGPTLGSPEVLMESECGVQFSWKTSAACKTAPRRNHVPCYVIDKDGNKRNLEGLTTLPMYSVLTADRGVSIYLSVCSDINSDITYCPNCPACTNCPPNTSAIRVIDRKRESIGQMGSKLEIAQEGLHLFYGPPSYTNGTLPERCTHPPTTSVIFRCPERLRSRRPRVISDIDCQYEIEWETEHACPESTLKADFKTCKFTKEIHGIDLDLSPLRKTDGLYEVTTRKNYSYVFNMCGGIGDYKCNDTVWASSAVCYKHGNTSEVIAITNNAKLTLVERYLSLKYEGPECRDGKKHSTVFSFSCDHNAKFNGTGYPVYILSLDCTHFFTWETKYACLPYKPEIPCYVSTADKYFDLRRLKKDHEFVWSVMSPRGKDSQNKQLYFMNVCGPAFGSMPYTTASCEGDPAVTRTENNTCVNLGEFNSPPSYDPVTKSLKLEYTNGSICKENVRWSSVVEFKCYPGRFFSDVILTHVNEAGCVNEFEFRSAIACPSTILTGKDCKLVDPETGVNIDLSPLSSSVYEVTESFGTFFLSVCGSLPKDNTCIELLNSSSDVAACAMKNGSDPSAQNIGAPSSQIGYVYGNINLTYTGDKYETVILFMCSVHGNNGLPVFSRIIGTTYIFHWYTSLVCPQPASTQCLISNPATGEQYDFSGLAKAEDNWVSYFSEEVGEKKVERKLYINVCRSLNPAPSCDRDAAACIVTINGDKEEKYLPNVGRATSSPQPLSSEHLQLHYEQGKSCTAFGQDINYSTVVHFICSETDSSRPKFIGKIGECQYSFFWLTKAACPLQVISLQNECVLTDPITGFTFDLTPLKSENLYTVSAEDQTYKLNICSSVKHGCTNDNSEGSITACEIDKDGQITTLSTMTNFTLQYIERRHLILTYFNKTSDSNNSKTDNMSEVVITMLCDNNASEVQPVFIKKDEERYLFELKTPLVCLKEVGSCNFRDSKGRNYDITSLFYSSRNWEVVDRRSDAMYHINFCRPLIKVPPYNFPGGASGAVMTGFRLVDKVGVSLGVQLSVPTVSEDGTVIVRYTDGDFCREGQRRSTRINLFCTHTQGELVFVGETSECEYLFSMNTPAACSIQTAIGHNCIVTDPIYGYTFNLNLMKNPLANFSAEDGRYKYFISVCDKLSGFKGPCENAGVCQTEPDDPSFSKSLGLPNSNLLYSEGIITLKYDLGSLCHNKYNRSAVIKFTCEHPVGSTLNKPSRPYFISEAEDCTYFFEWPTVFACPPFHLTGCSAVDESGQLYDLSELSLASANYYVRNPMDSNQTFVINVCKTVIYSPDSLCPYVSAACLLDPTNIDTAKRARNIGQVAESPYFEDGKLKIKYTSGDPCTLEKGSSARFMETVIEFNCDMQKIKSEPEFLGQDVCTYFFTWSTAYACSLNDTAIEEKGGCVATDPYTGFEFNFSALKNNEPYIVKSQDHQYFLNVCGNVKTSPCGEKSGVCQQELQGKKRAWNAGIANSKLVYQNGILFLNYSGGAPCHNNTYQRNTIIHFHCSVGTGQPNFLYESSDCTYYFTWGTEHACQSQIYCAVKNGSHLFDLTPLTVYPYYSAENHVDDDSASYFISVCSALNNHAVPVSCPEGSAICRHSGDKAVSLGSVGYPPFVDFEGHATIIYTNGSECVSNPSEQYKSRIIFICDPDELLGKPVLVRVEDDVCVYVFEWRTSVICPLEPTVSPQSRECFFADNGLGIHFDLSPLKKIGSHYEVDDGDRGGKFLINICGPVEEEGCSGSAICLQESDRKIENYGTSASEKFLYDGGRIRATFTGGEPCPYNVAMKKSSEIIFSCNPNKGLGTPKLLRKKYSCLATFIWETNIVCQGVKHACVFDVGNMEIDVYQLSSLSHNWNTTDPQNNTYFLNICNGLIQDDESKGCPTNAAVCMKGNNSSKALGLLQAVTENVTDSGDVLITYTSGSTNVCSSVDANGQLSATSKITLKCGLSLGQPKFVSGPDSNCVFHFVWETNIVCKSENEELVYEGNGTLTDKRLNYEMDLSSILDRTFKVSGMSHGQNYTYVINIANGYSIDATNKGDDDVCSSAAVCQTKPENHFYRDIGSVNSRRFREKGSELHLSLVSLTRGCGKNKYRNVTTLFILKCTSYSGDGSPVFLYESGGCDYIFIWDTNAVCSSAHRRISPTESPPSAQDNSAEGHVSHSSSSTPAVIIAVLCIILILSPIVYIVSNKERRSGAAAKIRSAFHRVTLPHFRYRRADGEMLILINGTQVNQSDAFKDDDLLS